MRISMVSPGAGQIATAITILGSGRYGAGLLQLQAKGLTDLMAGYRELAAVQQLLLT